MLNIRVKTYQLVNVGIVQYNTHYITIIILKETLSAIIVYKIDKLFRMRNNQYDN